MVVHATSPIAEHRPSGGIGLFGFDVNKRRREHQVLNTTAAPVLAAVRGVQLDTKLGNHALPHHETRGHTTYLRVRGDDPIVYDDPHMETIRLRTKVGSC